MEARWRERAETLVKSCMHVVPRCIDVVAGVLIGIFIDTWLSLIFPVFWSRVQSVLTAGQP